MIKQPSLSKKWALCPKCRMKTVLYDNSAQSSGVWIKCTRGCGAQFELVIKDGEQEFSAGNEN